MAVKCENCTEKCPQADRAHQAALGRMYATNEFIELLKKVESCELVEVVHGHWYEHHGITICSHCQAMFDTDLTMLQIPSTWKMPKYCPNCGAKMGGDGNG